MFSSGGTNINSSNIYKSNKINVSNHISSSVKNPHFYLSKKAQEPIPVLDKIPEDML